MADYVRGLLWHWAPGGFLEGRCLRMADYVRGLPAPREAPQRANVAYALTSPAKLGSL